MLTHTIRALSLLALIAVAHTLRPFSSNNVTVFAANAVTSVARLLPAQTLERWQDFGSLAALVTGHPDPLANRFAQFAETVALARSDSFAPSKPLRQTAFANRAGRMGRRVARTTSYQARGQRNVGGVPLPLIPGLEASLLTDPSLLTFPPLLTAEGFDLPHHSFGPPAFGVPAFGAPAFGALGAFGLQQRFNNFERDDEAVSEEPTSFLETGAHKPLPAAAPKLTFRTLAPLQRTNSNAQACPQSAKNTKGSVSTKGQSC